eukprot:scaffold61680_cov66-Phaeocystis_antarctica.AAC.2
MQRTNPVLISQESRRAAPGSRYHATVNKLVNVFKKYTAEPTASSLGPWGSRLAVARPSQCQIGGTAPAARR